MNVSIYFLILLAVFSMTDSTDYLIDTPGCKIPDFSITIPEQKKHLKCGERKVYAEKINDYDVVFTITDNLQDCCYKFVKTQFYNDYYTHRNVTYTTCKPIPKKAIRLESDFIIVQCKGYEDAYSFVRKIKNIKHSESRRRRHWNVILLGLDRTSRSRAYASLAGTIKYLKEENWLDFKGYNKIGDNTYPNIVPLLSGKNESAFAELCRLGMSECNHLLIWSQYKMEGYVTAYGEDSVYLKDTFYRGKGFRKPPTDHFMKPLFNKNEKLLVDGLVCNKKIASGEQILNFILDFVDTYKNENFFGYFWLASFSHDSKQHLRNYDVLLERFFSELADLENTFIIFFSDHGMRYGAQKKTVESFYEDRLPMLFIKPPLNMKITFPQLYSNLIYNQARLTSPKDLHITLLNMLKRKNIYTKFPKYEGCPKCQSLLRRIPPSRTCSDAGIPDYYCACRIFQNVTMQDYGAMYSMIQLIMKVQNKSQTVKTKRCKYCAPLSLKQVTRSHYYTHKNTTFYLLAFTMTPGNTGFEGIVSKREISGRYVYNIHPIKVITPWSANGNCVINNFERAYCFCKTNYNCLPRTKIVKTHVKPPTDFFNSLRTKYEEGPQNLPKPLRRRAKNKKNRKLKPLLHFKGIPDTIIEYPTNVDPNRYLRVAYPFYLQPPL